jgi:hypothetical protein
MLKDDHSVFVVVAGQNPLQKDAPSVECVYIIIAYTARNITKII